MFNEKKDLGDKCVIHLWIPNWITKNPQKSPKKFNCKKCDYHCSNKKDFNKHLRTTKHSMDNKWITKKSPKIPRASFMW